MIASMMLKSPSYEVWAEDGRNCRFANLTFRVRLLEQRHFGHLEHHLVKCSKLCVQVMRKDALSAHHHEPRPFTFGEFETSDQFQ